MKAILNSIPYIDLMLFMSILWVITVPLLIFTSRWKVPLIFLSGLSIIICVFTVVSFHAVFRNWPWTQTKSIYDGRYYGLRTEQGKLEAFNQISQYQNDDRAVYLILLDEGPMTYDEKFKGDGLQPEDFERVGESDSWKIGLAEDRAWLRIEFEADKIKSIKHYKYYGPTK